MNLEDMTLDELKELRERLLEKKKELKNKAREIYDYWDEIDSKFFESDNPEKDKKNYDLEKEKINKRLDKIYEEIDKLRLPEVEDEIYFKKPPAATNNIIDLRKGGYLFFPVNEDNVVGRYNIFLHDSKICVGYIDYRGYHCQETDRDVGYIIDKEALKLQSDLLYKNEIDSFWLTVQKWNIPSIKTIEKYGGHLIKEHGNNILQYECKTRKIEEINNKVK